MDFVVHDLPGAHTPKILDTTAKGLKQLCTLLEANSAGYSVVGLRANLCSAHLPSWLCATGPLLRPAP